MTNSADPDQFASSEANWSGSTLFAKTGHFVFSKVRVKVNVNTRKKIAVILQMETTFLQTSNYLSSIWNFSKMVPL